MPALRSKRRQACSQAATNSAVRKIRDDRATAKAEQRFPVDVYMCDDCGHVQHLDVINASDLWDSYTYFSGEAKGMPEHFAQIAAKIRRTYDPPAGSLVVDIGSNDGSLLKPFKAAGHRVLGIDPPERGLAVPSRPEFRRLPS
jgi:hypothetical protein